MTITLTQQNWDYNPILLFSEIVNQTVQKKFPHLERGQKKYKEIENFIISFRNLRIIVHFIF